MKLYYHKTDGGAEYEYIKIFEHPMSASNIDITFMEEVKQ